MLLVTVSLLSGLMIYILIMNRAELNSSLSARFVKALKNEALSLVYQPIYRIEDGQICGFEALLRWKDERLGILTLKYLYRFLKGKGCRRM